MKYVKFYLLMSLPGVEVPIEKCLPKILLRLGKENPSKRQCKVARLFTAQVRCDVVSFGTISVRYVHLVMTNLVHACSCSSAGRAGRKGMAAVSVVHVLCIYYVYPFRNRFVRFLTAGRYANECCVTSHDTSATVFGNLPGFEHRRVIHQKNFRSSSIIFATLNFW